MRGVGKKSQGFTLIELMIVVVVIGILSMIALPSYQDYVRKSRRADVMTKMLDTQLYEEKWRANNSQYAITATSIGSPTSDYYTITIGSVGASTYTINATATGNQAKDKQNGTSCTTLTINQSNTKTPADCWRK
ncbi:MAG TPA: type IV pilin protein [Methylophilaceae bacterium]|jgi:type IV pilus assembly protein PilE|nr:type IV pilin protein [Methylophilaceae bacterium]